MAGFYLPGRLYPMGFDPDHWDHGNNSLNFDMSLPHPPTESRLIRLVALQVSG
jgi:hypothetical protein